MASCGCTNGATSKRAGDETRQDTDDMYLKATFSGGFKYDFCNFRKKLSVSKITLPNIVSFSEDPCLAIGTRILFQNTARANCIDTISNGFYTVTSAPVLVAGEYQVTVDTAWTTAGTQTSFAFQSFGSYDACGTGVEDEPLSVKVCGANQLAENWSGYITTRPLNSASVVSSAIVRQGSNVVTASNSKFRPQVGDYLTLQNTAIVDANRAIIIEITRDEVDKDGNKVVTMTLDRPVTGITAAPVVGSTTNYCVRAIAKVKTLAEIFFTPKACCVTGMIDKALTSSEQWPRGNDYAEAGKCGGQEYCFTIMDKNPNSEVSHYQGIVLFT